MNMTALARSLIEPVPARRTVGIRVLNAANGNATITMDTPVTVTNVIGSLHSSGLVALVDAAGLAAIIAGCDLPAEFDGVLPVGRSAALQFRAPAFGRLVAVCSLTTDARQSLRDLCSRGTDKVRFSTVADVMDSTSTIVCSGEFRWTARRMPVETRVPAETAVVTPPRVSDPQGVSAATTVAG